jgi:uncharacterized membrane protein YfcA
VDHIALLFTSAVLAGAVNAVAGGGSFFTFPALVAVGVPMVPASATSTLAVWPGGVTSAIAYRRELSGQGRLLWGLGSVSVLGGAAGALLLVSTPPLWFERLVPVLLLVATLLFAFGHRLTAALRVRAPSPGGSSLWGLSVVQLVISVYGGYFGGGMGMMMLAAYTLFGMEDLHQMNGIKSVTAVALNAAALVAFALQGVIVWEHGLVMMSGAMAGGFAGATLARRISPRVVRIVIAAIGFLLVVVFAVRAL